jgi:anti-anti-sigma factor
MRDINQTALRFAPLASEIMDNYGFEITELDTCLVATFRGEISTSCYSEFRNDYNEICRLLSLSDTKRVVLDLTETQYFGSLFIGMIVKLSCTIRSQQGRLALCGLSDQLKELMKKLLLLERESDSVGRLKHLPTRAEAITQLNAEDA